jgi:hypothetical protein
MAELISYDDFAKLELRGRKRDHHWGGKRGHN